MDRVASCALMDETRRLYTRILETYAAAGTAPEQELNVFWSAQNLTDMRAILAESADAHEALARVQSTHLFQVNSSDAAKEFAVDWHLDSLFQAGQPLSTLPAELEESEYAPAEMQVRRDDRLLTPDFFRILNHALLVPRFCAPRGAAVRFAELGAGCGHLARLLTILYPASTYAIVDIPETLCFSYLFLKINFPERSALMLTARGQSPPPANVDLLFVPTLLADAITGMRPDVFLNTASMGEMKNEVIRHWMRFIQEGLQPSHLVTVNRYLNTIEPGIHDWRLNENECAVHYDDRWHILHWELEPPYFRCPFILPLAARHLEIVARRLPTPSPPAVSASRRAVTRLEHQDWVKFESVTPAMTLRDHTLCPDFTTSGALFTLWDAIRVDPRPPTVLLMLKYLSTLLHRDDREFEEAFYYETLLETLLAHDATAAQRQEILTWLAERRLARKRHAPSVRLLKSVGRYNLIAAGERVLALAQSLGPVDLAAERIGERELPPHILLGTDVASLEERILRDFSA